MNRWLSVFMVFLSTLAFSSCDQAPPTPTPAPLSPATPTLVLTPIPAPSPTILPARPRFTPELRPVPELKETPAPIYVSTPAPTLASTTIATPQPSPDTTPPSAITGLIAVNAYDGRVNLWWNRSTAADFDRYNVYVSKSELADVTGMVPVYQAKDISTSNYQATSLENGTKYYFAVAAVDKSGNENKRVASLSVTPSAMPRGTLDLDLVVDVYRTEMAWPGTTLFADNHNRERPRIIEVNMKGEIIWQHTIPENLKRYTNPGFDVELLPNNNILFLLPRHGVYEIDRSGKVVWSYVDPKVSHDTDRLSNGNTLVVWGEDEKSDAQVKEINQNGEVVWAWYARDHFDKPPYQDIYEGGWTHTNSVTRLPDGNTLISLRNFHFVVEVDPKGSIVRTLGEGIFFYQHDPEIQPDSNILATSPPRHRVVEIDANTGKIIWEFSNPNLFPRDADRLPNGNILITGAARILEVTAEGNIVWQLTVKGIPEGRRVQPEYLYKADRISAGK